MQFNNLVKLFIVAREEYQQLLTGDDLQLDCHWIEEQHFVVQTQGDQVVNGSRAEQKWQNL